MADRKVLVRKDKNFEEIKPTDIAEVGSGVKASLNGNLILTGNNIIADAAIIPSQTDTFSIGIPNYDFYYVRSKYLTGGQCTTGIAGGEIFAGAVIGVANTLGNPRLLVADGFDPDDNKYAVGVALNDALPGDEVVYQYSGIVTLTQSSFFAPPVTINKYGPLWLYNSGLLSFNTNLNPGYLNQKIGSMVRNTGDGTFKVLLQLGYSYVQP